MYYKISDSMSMIQRPRFATTTCRYSIDSTWQRRRPCLASTVLCNQLQYFTVFICMNGLTGDNTVTIAAVVVDVIREYIGTFPAMKTSYLRDPGRFDCMLNADQIMLSTRRRRLRLRFDCGSMPALVPQIYIVILDHGSAML